MLLPQSSLHERSREVSAVRKTNKLLLLIFPYCSIFIFLHRYNSKSNKHNSHIRMIHCNRQMYPLPQSKCLLLLNSYYFRDLRNSNREQSCWSSRNLNYWHPKNLSCMIPCKLGHYNSSLNAGHCRRHYCLKPVPYLRDLIRTA